MPRLNMSVDCGRLSRQRGLLKLRGVARVEEPDALPRPQAVDLLGRDVLSADRDRYLAATVAGQDGIQWLHAHYGGRLPEYGGFYDGTQMTAGMAYGFWLRRSDDGSADALWNGLRDFMQLYDPEWLSELLARYPGVG